MIGSDLFHLCRKLLAKIINKGLAMSKTIFVLVVLLATATESSASDVLKIGFLHENPVGQGGWTLSHETAREKLEKHYGNRIQTSAIDGIAPGVDAERILTKYARNGTDLIFATSFGFLNPTQKVSKRYKKTIFEHASGYLQASNVGTYQIRGYQGRYLSGIVAGATTKTNVIGYVGSFPIPEVIRGVNAFALGVQSVNPEAKIELIWTHSWSDPAKEKEATELLIAKQSDIVTHHSESASVMNAAKAKKVFSIGYQTDRSHAAAEYHLVSVVHNWFPIYKNIIDEMLDKSWTSKNRWLGVEHNASQLVGFHPTLSESTLSLVESKRSAMAAGEFKVFSGPIRDQEGGLRVRGGEEASDEYLLSMEWLVSGVVGKISGN